MMAAPMVQQPVGHQGGGYGGYGMGAMGAIPTHTSTLNPLLGSTSAIPMTASYAAPMITAAPVGHSQPIVHQEQLVHRHVPVVHEQTVEVPPVQYQERIVEVPHVQTQEVVRHVPVPIVQEREVQVAKIE